MRNDKDKSYQICLKDRTQRFSKTINAKKWNTENLPTRKYSS